ncbi:MAG: metallophosphoesterase family protein [Capsulimonadaceae bacterium]
MHQIRPIVLAVALLLWTLCSIVRADEPPKKTVDAKYTFVVYGDTRSQVDVHRDVVAEIVKLRPEFVLQSGDLVQDGHNPEEWAQFRQIEAPIRDAHIAYYPARGNHDVGPYYHNVVTEPYDSGNAYYYAFTRHEARFIVLDSMDPEEFASTSDQYLWAASEMEAAHRAGRPFFVMFHEAPFSVGPHGPTPDAQQMLHPLFVKYRPTAVFCGHDHLYYQTRRDGVLYLLTGGGGAPLYKPDNAALAIAGDVYASVHHVIKIDVDGPHISATVIPVDAGRMEGTHQVVHVDVDGSHSAPISGAPIDQFTINSP